MSPDAIHFSSLFFPRELTARVKLERENGRFAHYTSAGVAMSILSRKEIWMRNALTMNDFSEIRHGKECLLPAYGNREIGGELKRLLEGMFPGISSEIEKAFNERLPHLEQDTYLTCLSEHDPTEDELGRLSMWRAYAPVNGVALVLKNTRLTAESNELGAYSSTVAYLSPDGFAAEFKAIVEGMKARSEQVRALGREMVMWGVSTMFRFAALCTKHPGFAEEREWRIMHSPTINSSQAIYRSFEVIRGIPQEVYKIPLIHDPAKGLHHANPQALLDRVIIGPTAQPFTMWKTFVALLREAGIEDAEAKVAVSQIPLRT